ncbi:MAG: hypothetical protein WBL66_13615 [Candidatus Acidiferrales bacterium]
MAEKKESARTTIILAVATLAVGMYALAYGLQTEFYFQARHWASRSAFLKEVPQALPSMAVSPPQEKNLSFYDMSFDAPWKGIAAQNKGDAHSEVDFTAGPVIVFFNPQGEKDIISGIRDGDPQTYDRYEALFGEDLFPSNYDLYMAVYSASPASLSPFMQREQLERIGTLLEWKLAFGASGASAIYNVQTDSLRGLQFGDPARDPMVVVRLFDTRNQQFRLLFTSKGGTGTFPQSDINCVVDSFQPATQPR